jgi:c-di-GMP-binding flagellar brake protein YcgR
MSPALQQANDEYAKQRSAFRISMIADEPVYLLLSMEGMDIDPIVDELGGGGARLVSAKHYDYFYVGQLIGPAVLVLQDEGMPVLYPVVKWKSWPVIGVEFMEISEKDREMIIRFLFKVERRMVQQGPKPGLRRRPH